MRVVSVLRKARVLFGVWFAFMTAYRAEVAIWVLNGLLPLVMMAVWIGKTAAEGAVGGFTPQGFAAYFLAAWLTEQLTFAWAAWELDYQIRHGELSPKLLRPLDPVWEQATQHLTEKVVRLPVVAIVVASGLALVPGTSLTPDVPHALAYVAAVAFAFAMRFLIAHCIGLLAFWFDRVTAIEDFYWVAASFLAGGFAPLEFYPPLVRQINEWTPFPYLLYHPVRIFNGEADGPEIARVFAVQAAWLVGLLLLRAFLWRRGLRRYSAVGA